MKTLEDLLHELGTEIRVPNPPSLEDISQRRPPYRRPLPLAVAASVLLIVALLAVPQLAGDSDTRVVASDPEATDPAPVDADLPVLDGLWRDVSPAPLAARFQHTAVWTGNEMIVWGGWQRGDRFFNDGASYDPASDSWREVAPSPLSPRAGHVAVWTGDEMIVWGGYVREAGESEGLVDGAAYDPTTDAWRLLPPAPLAAGTELAAVWTGDEMIVWGGVPDPGHPSDDGSDEGAAYDPVADTWSALPAAPLDARTNPGAAWTGEELFLWGGASTTLSREPRSDGAVYVPSTEAWHLIEEGPLDPAPQARAVAAGDAALVIGIDPDKSIEAAQVGLFTPASGKWKSLGSLPESRVVFSALWTGEHLLVWGGGGPDQSGYRKTGWALDPESGEWSTLPPATASKRMGHVAVWTGDEMIVWGGFAAETLADGARFQPTGITDTAGP